ncbi:MAG TPA: hypothetical protein VK892_02055 [Pyrinomonadaceae bacterium]|nr:hypothetical protein [Pyrinomonadaceae bacterium]
MKNLLSALVVVLAFSSVSFSKLMLIPLDEAVKGSDLIIIGTLKNISEKVEENGTYGKGEIFVEQFIAGNVKTAYGSVLEAGNRLQLNYAETFACVMGSHRRIENEKGIFLLTLNESGEIQSKDFRSLEDLTEIKKLLKRGVKPNKDFKTIKIQNEVKQISTVETASSENSEISFCAYSIQPETKYHPFSALSVVLASLSLYYLLYRSRFKIR